MKAGILKNTLTNRFHPIIFHEAPFPGQSVDRKIGSVVRYRSYGHHTNGFDTLEQAQDYVRTEHKGYVLLDGIGDWDGVETPAMTFLEPFNG